jgi:ubiquinone biosynthesis monooxygenase Coq6
LNHRFIESIERAWTISRLLIGADGANSSVRNLADISTYGWSYGQEAVVATVKVDQDIDADYDGMTAYQRYLHTGPIAMLPLWDNYVGIVWSLPVSEAQRVKLLTSDQLIAELNAAFSSPNQDSTDNSSDSKIHSQPSILSKSISMLRDKLKSSMDLFISTSLIIDRQRKAPVIKEISSPKILSFPLQFRQASNYIANRVALAGDAAHSIHPQAGQGLNLGLADVQCLSSTIMNAILSGQDYGDSRVLQSYEDKRYAANLTMMGTVDVLNAIFKDAKLAPESGLKAIPPAITSRIQALKQSARTVGMLGIHSFPPIKHRIAKFATGSNDEL